MVLKGGFEPKWSASRRKPNPIVSGIVKSNPTSLPVAVRVFPSLERTEPKNRTDKIWRAPRAMFVVDTETRIDSTQRLTFGSYRFFVGGEVLEGGLFYAADLSKEARKTLE